jgi:hypothetical protein
MTMLLMISVPGVAAAVGVRSAARRVVRSTGAVTLEPIQANPERAAAANGERTLVLDR